METGELTCELIGCIKICELQGKQRYINLGGCGSQCQQQWCFLKLVRRHGQKPDNLSILLHIYTHLEPPETR